MEQSTISHSDRRSLECYVRTEHRAISFSEVFRFYIPSICVNGGMLLFGSIVSFAIPHSESTIPLNHTVGYCLLSMLGLLLLHFLHVSFRSIGHWELLKRVLDWKRVHELLEETDADDA